MAYYSVDTSLHLTLYGGYFVFFLADSGAASRTLHLDCM
jgi:hypothetical protein